MKHVAQVVLLGTALMLLQSCDLGYNNSQLGNGSTIAGGGVTFNLSALESVAPDFVHSFSLTGSDTAGNNWTGSVSVQNLSSTTFNGAAAIPRVETLALTNTQTNAFVNTQQTLYLGPGFQILGWADSFTGVNCVPQGTFAVIPASVAVGQSGVLGTLGCSDGTQRRYAWRVDSVTGNINNNNSLSITVIVADMLDGAGARLTTEEDGYVLDAAGGLHGFTLFTRDFTTRLALTMQSPII